MYFMICKDGVTKRFIREKEDAVLQFCPENDIIFGTKEGGRYGRQLCKKDSMEN
jgi:hypothetical protein